MKHWLLLTKENSRAVWILPGGDYYIYEIAPESELKRGDEVYLWANGDSAIFGWGIVDESPQTIRVEVDRPNGDKETIKRYRVEVHRLKEFRPPLADWMMRRERTLKDLVPKGYGDLLALPLRPGQAAYINDFIREHNLDAPQASATINWKVLERAPDITVQALLTYGDKKNEGRLVEGVRIAWDEIVKIINKDPEEIYRIDPRKFEELIAGAYERTGQFDEVILTPSSADDGRDIIATKNGFGSIRIYDQVKRYKITRPVTANDIRAIVGVLTIDANVSKGIVTTTSTFAPTLLEAVS